VYVPDLQAKRQKYSYKSDDDLINKGFQDATRQVYGEWSQIFDNEFVDNENKLEVIYSPTPSVLSGMGAILPAIDTISPDNNIRVLLNNGKKTDYSLIITEDVTPTSAQIVVNEYLHTSMFDDDLNPQFTILYGVPSYLFYPSWQNMNPETMYALHYYRQAKAINDGRMIVAMFDLSPSDAARIRKRKDWNIYIRDEGYFYINKVVNYQAALRQYTMVELIKADSEVVNSLSAPVRPAPSRPA
jgi:hypothetical protein